MQKGKKTKRDQKQKGVKQQFPKANLPFGVQNYLIFGFGIILLIVGFYFLAQTPSDPALPRAEGFLSLNIAPIFLVLAYLVVFPVAILVKKTRKTPGETNQ